MKWTQLFNNKILNRGEKYALEKRVEILRKDEKQINAKVYGSKNYEVEIKFYGDKIEKMSCNCPYASTANCKHLAATLYTIYGVKELKHEDISIEKLLKMVSDEELRDFISDEFQRNENLYNEFRVFKGITDEEYYSNKLNSAFFYNEYSDILKFINEDLKFLLSMGEYELILILLEKIFDQLYYNVESNIYSFDDEAIFYEFKSIIKNMVDVYSKSKILEFLEGLAKCGDNFLCDEISELIVNINLGKDMKEIF